MAKIDDVKLSKVRSDGKAEIIFRLYVTKHLVHNSEVVYLSILKGLFNLIEPTEIRTAKNVSRGIWQNMR